LSKYKLLLLLKSRKNTYVSDLIYMEICITRKLILLAGALYVLVNGFDDEMPEKDRGYIGNQFIFTVIAAGYAGSDFIEGLFSTYLAKLPTPNSGGGNKVVPINPEAVQPASADDTTEIASSPSDDRGDHEEEQKTASGHVATSA
jgi:hypothetical protein